MELSNALTADDVERGVGNVIPEIKRFDFAQFLLQVSHEIICFLDEHREKLVV